MAIEKTTIFTIVLVLLVIISGAQAIQLSSLSDDISSGSVSSGTSTPTTSSSGDSGRVTTPSSIQNLPKMVGGC